MEILTKHTTYLGDGESGLIWDYGTLTTERTAFATITSTVKAIRNKWRNIPNINAPHPIFPFLYMEHRDLSFSGSYAVAQCQYCGFDTVYGANSIPVYDLLKGVTEEPIETLPNFATHIGGTPKNPLNRARFRKITSPGSGVIVDKDNPATTNFGYEFAGFDPYSDNTNGFTVPPSPVPGVSPAMYLNAFAKMERYLAAENMTWRKSWCSRIAPTAMQLSKVGKIDTPDGPFPQLPNGRNWLKMELQSNQRGVIFQMTQDWRASGPRGWNKIVYG